MPPAPRILAVLTLFFLAGGACTTGRTPQSPTPTGSALPPGPFPATGAPNILILLSDDQSIHLFDRSLMPRVFADLVDHGAAFNRAYVNLSQCCPSRSSILTGLYAHNTGVDDNTIPLDTMRPVRPVFPVALHDAGYRTMLAGKYLNSETCDPRPGWDRWVCGTQVTEVNPTLNVDGAITHFTGYTADILASGVMAFLRQADPSRPFFVYYAPRDPHTPADDPRLRSLNVPFYNPPSFDAQPDPATVPAYARVPPMSTFRQLGVTGRYERMAQQIPLLDADIGRILDALGPRASDTFVLFMTDNGYLYGEHRLEAKNVPYEESVRVPFVIRYPKLIARPFASDALVSNVDIAPTVMDLAGIPWSADGRSLVPLLERRVTGVRTALLIEWCQAGDRTCPSVPGSGIPPAFWGLETDRYAYIEYATGEAELFDLRTDPFELSNLAGLTADAAIRQRLSVTLALLRAPPAIPATTIGHGPVGAAAPGPVAFDFFSQDRTTGFRCRLAGPGQPGSVATYDGGSVTYPLLAPGRYKFSVVAVTAAGVADPTPATRAFTVP